MHVQLRMGANILPMVAKTRGPRTKSEEVEKLANKNLCERFDFCHLHESERRCGSLRITLERVVCHFVGHLLKSFNNAKQLFWIIAELGFL